MHVRPIVIVAILAAAAGASVARLPVGRDSPADAAPSALARGSFGVRNATVGAHAPRVAPAVVYVAGDVRHPGVYALPDGARVADALRAAGGPTAGADPIAVDLAAHIEDGEEIAVPARGAAEAASVPGSDESVATPRKRKHARGHRRHKRAHRKASTATVEDDASAAPSGTAGAPETVDVNAADAATLATLPGIGSGLAERIVAFRALNGPFASADELLDVGGMTARNVDRLMPLVTFGVPLTGTHEPPG